METLRRFARWSGSWWTVLAGLVIWLVLKAVDHSDPAFAQKPAGVLLTWELSVWLTLWLSIAALAVAVVAHELGHVVADVLLDFRVMCVRLGPLVVAGTSAGWRASLDRNQLSRDAELRAWVSSCPRSPDRLRARHAASVAAGPLAALLAAAAVAALAARLGSLPLAIAAAAAAALTPFDLVVGWFQTAGSWSDSRWLVCWLREPEVAAHRVAVGTLLVPRVLGQRPREWGDDDRWIGLAACGPRPPSTRQDARGCQLAYYAALDRGLGAEAARLAARTYELRHLAAAAARPLLAAELAFCLARFQGDAATAERLLAEAEAQQPRAHPADAGRARAAIHLVAGRPAEALAACDQALQGLPEAARAAGLAVMSRELVESMREEALAGLDPAGDARVAPAAAP